MSDQKIISFSEARVAGLVRYFTGQPCRHSHVAERLVSNRGCVACQSARAAEWKRSNPEKHAAQKVSWVRRNPEKYRAAKSAWSKAHPESQAKRSRKWFLANKEKASSSAREYRKRNLGRHSAKAARHRAESFQRTPAWADLNAISEIYDQASALRAAGEMVEVDHIVPLRGKTVSGLHVESNLQIIPALKNKAKSNHFLEI